MSASWRSWVSVAVLAALPVIALAPAWTTDHLLGPGDGATLHYPLRAAVWRAYRSGELPAWNSAIFSGTPLLGAYRPGALSPLMPLLASLPDFIAFQSLILCSLALTGILTYVYVRQLGACAVGAYFAGMGFALGPYVVGHIDDSATIAAIPALLLLLIAAEAFFRRSRPFRGFLLALALASLLVAGSQEASRAGLALVMGRLLVHVVSNEPRVRVPLWRYALPVLGGLGLAAPQLIPTLLAASEAGRQAVGVGGGLASELPGGAAGLLLRYISHTPAPALAIAALPLTLRAVPVRFFAVALIGCLVAQWGRGPLTAPGAAPLVFDLALATLAGLSLSHMWQTRSDAGGRRPRFHYLLAALASAAALPLSVIAIGPLSQNLTAGVGLLAVGQILFFPLIASRHRGVAGAWLLPLTVAFLLQPEGRQVWNDAPTQADLSGRSATREAIDRLTRDRPGETVLTLARRWRPAEAFDLALGNLGLLTGRRSANGYDPMVALRYRQLWDGMSAAGIVPAGLFYRSTPERLEAAGIRWVQVPSSELAIPSSASQLGEALDQPVFAGRSRFYPFPMSVATEVVLVSSLSESVKVSQGTLVARLLARTASGHTLDLPIRAGLETAEWAYERRDVRPRVRHGQPPIFSSWPGTGGDFEGHHYLATLRLPGRYLVDGLKVERVGDGGPLLVARLAVQDARTGQLRAATNVAGFVSDTTHFREQAATPRVRLFELPHAQRLAWIARGVRPVASDEAAMQALRHPSSVGVALDQEVLTLAPPPSGVLTSERKPTPVFIERVSPSRMDLRVEGPGLVVVNETWDPGWSARVDLRQSPIQRVNQTFMAVVVREGNHRLTLEYRVRGLWLGIALALGSLAGLLADVVRGRARTNDLTHVEAPC
jgi:hypothetical protein